MWLAKAFYQFEFNPEPENTEEKKENELKLSNKPPDVNSMSHS